jgi:hypothetical protein
MADTATEVIGVAAQEGGHAGKKRDRGEEDEVEAAQEQPQASQKSEGDVEKRAKVNDAPAPARHAAPPPAAAESAPVVLKMVIPNVDAGRIIGKSGLVLKQIMDDSGARVRLSANLEVIPQSGDRIITCIGSLETVGKAQQMISAALNDPRPGEPAEQPRTLKVSGEPLQG